MKIGSTNLDSFGKEADKGSAWVVGNAHNADPLFLFDMPGGESRELSNSFLSLNLKKNAQSR
jgi:hypothetical protein